MRPARYEKVAKSGNPPNAPIQKQIRSTRTSTHQAETNPLFPSIKTIHPRFSQGLYPYPVLYLVRKSMNTVAKMPIYPPANFDAILEHIVTVILKLTLTHPLALALSQSFVNTFDDSCTIDINDIHEFRYNMTSVPLSTPGIKLHVTVVKKIKCMVSYARYKEEMNHTDCDTPIVWDTDVYSKWCRNGYATYLTSLIPVPSSTAAATSTPATATTTTAAFVTTAQKNDDAALISWNRILAMLRNIPYSRTMRTIKIGN
jgi:hypothetical protein